MTELLEELGAIDTNESHLKTLDNLMTVYLCSEEANDHKERVDVVLLLSKLRGLFV